MIFKITSEQSMESVIQYIKKLNLLKKYDVQITAVKQVRSIQQSRLYWLWLNCIANETGNDKEDMHAYFSGMYLPDHEFTVKFMTLTRPISTTQLDTAQFTQYLEKIQQFAASELGIILPVPEDLIFEQFKEYYEKYI